MATPRQNGAGNGASCGDARGVPRAWSARPRLVPDKGTARPASHGSLQAEFLPKARVGCARAGPRGAATGGRWMAASWAGAGSSSGQVMMPATTLCLRPEWPPAEGTGSESPGRAGPQWTARAPAGLQRTLHAAPPGSAAVGHGSYLCEHRDWVPPAKMPGHSWSMAPTPNARSHLCPPAGTMSSRVF